MLDNKTVYRNEGYTSDGYFCIKTVLENKNLQKKKTSIQLPNIKRVVELETTNKEFIQLTANPIVCDTGELKIIRLTSNKKQTAFIQKKYLQLFGSLKDLELLQADEGEVHYTDSNTSPIIVKKNKEFAGIIMALRIQM